MFAVWVILAFILSQINVVLHLSQCRFHSTTITCVTDLVCRHQQPNSLSPMLYQAGLKCFNTAKNTHSRVVGSQVGLDSRRGKVNASGSFHTVFAGLLPARLRRSLCCCSPAPLFPLSGWTLWPSSSWIPNPVQEQKTCFCETFLTSSVCILLQKEMQDRAAEQC